MEIEYDEAKRRWTMEARGLDFADAPRVLDGDNITVVDERFEYGEERFLAYGKLDDRNVVVVWTLRQGRRRIISMRYMHDDEREKVERTLDRS